MRESQKDSSVILLIDDEAAVLAEVMSTLRAADYNCHGCTDPDAALEIARSIRPDLIISDINLEGKSGLELCQKMKSDATIGEVPVIFLSGAKIPNIVRRSREVGGTYYLRKPFDPDVLIELVDKALWMPQLVSNTLDRA